MRAWLRQHRQALGRALPRVSPLNALVIGIALALPAGGYALLESLRMIAGRIAVQPEISVFLDAKRADADQLAARLKLDPRVSRLRFVPRQQALKELAAVQGLPELVAALGRNPLPDAFVVTAADENLEALAADLAKITGVAQVQTDALWARRLASLARLARTALWLLAGVLAAALIAVTFNTIRLQILTQRAEIEVSKLIGATDSFIRRPFYYGGLLQGVAGGAFALLIVAGALALMNREVRLLAESYGSQFRFAYPDLAGCLAFLALAGLLGWLGAHLSVTRHLQEVEPS
ncbi:MAG TPA: permease-like cell division protein FtsX [Burkholderiales bacterium]|nr:permease-like cell division protein FtsX [Burkholderiales bacterium]